MKPKARKFRIRRSAPQTPEQPGVAGQSPDAGRESAPVSSGTDPNARPKAQARPQPPTDGGPQPGADRPGQAQGVAGVAQQRAAELARRKAAAEAARRNPTPPTQPGQTTAHKVSQTAPQGRRPTVAQVAAQAAAQSAGQAAQPAAKGPTPRAAQPAPAAPNAAIQPEGAGAVDPNIGVTQARATGPDAGPTPAPGMLPDEDNAAFGAAAAAAARAGEVASPREVRADLDIDTIRKEGLTGRQLRMARRVAQKHGLAPTSDFDAVRQLRAKGIDPFERSNMLQLVVPEGGGGANIPPTNLPQTVPAEGPQNLPSTEVSSADRRAAEISRLQQELAQRRRRRGLLLFVRLFFFVFAPTILAGWYFFVVATPMYATKSEFLILQAENQGGGGLGGLLSGTQFATNQDSIAVQSYLQSKDAMLRLDRDVGFKSHFTQPWIDPIQRLDTNPSNEEAYRIYKRNVKIGYDPTEGVIRMEVVAADPEVAALFSEKLITYSEERVDELTRRKRADGMRTAVESLERAKVERREAQERLVSLQEGTFLDPDGIIAGLRGQINNVDLQLQEKELQLAALLDNARPNKARVDGVRGDIERFKALQSDLNKRMTDATSGETSLAAKAAQIQMAQADLATADMFLQSALQNEKQTELEANRQVRYLTTSVRPVASEDASYPRAFENTVLAFLIFSGIYLMISLTASILREQVSA